MLANEPNYLSTENILKRHKKWYKKWYKESGREQRAKDAHNYYINVLKKRRKTI